MRSSKSLKFSAGTILWLPAKNEIANEHLDAAGIIEDGCFNHPVLILAVKPGNEEVIILMITSFGGKDLLERHPHNVRARAQHLPIYPSSIHPDNGSQLYLVNNSGLHRNSYIKTEVQRTIKTVLLRPTRHSTCNLRADSYDYLIKFISFIPPAPKPYIRICSSAPNALPASATWSKIAHSTPVNYTRPIPAQYAYPTPSYSTQPTTSHSTRPTPSYSTQPTPSYSTQPTPSYSTQPTPSYSTQPTPSYSTQPTPSYSTQPTPSYSTQPTPSYSTQPTPTRSTNSAPLPNHYTHPIPACYAHPAPTRTAHFNNRTSHTHWQTERTPLLPTVYNRTRPYSEQPEDWSNVSLVISFIVVAGLVAWAVWKLAGE